MYLLHMGLEVEHNDAYPMHLRIAAVPSILEAFRLYKRPHTRLTA